MVGGLLMATEGRAHVLQPVRRAAPRRQVSAVSSGERVRRAAS
ncbi:hypothetical protein [Nonomuraea typhae]|nr:hypothetical protein [Nonomuraea typhae]